MKITSVDIIDVANDFSSATSKWRPVVVKINTDEGITGFGEVGLAYGVGASAGFGMAKDLAKIIIGMDPMKNEAIWDKMQKKTFWGQGGGTVVTAGMSGIDIALWDIKGKMLNTPVYQLLGGKTRDKIRAYASQLQFGWGKGTDKAMLVEPQQYAEAALAAVDEGYDSIKIDVLAMDDKANWNQRNLNGVLSNRTLRLGYNRLKAVREAVGTDVDIIVEMHAFTDTTAAIQFGKMIEELGVYYYEEPVMPLNPKQMKKVADNVAIPIAAGERIYTRWGYRPFFEDGSIDVIQPDICTCGGLTEVKKICDMAHIYDVTVQIHVCGGPISTAAALQMEAAIPNFMIHELHRYALLEPNTTSCKYNYLPKDGMYDVPDLPGIGQELTEATIKASIVESVK
ncbi:mandelate racemase/muconate lactonizing enzyme family protein [Sporomusa sp. KB1]|jgi:L-alanine-DL-glutamate epimerase-like enolase superfamily enzyme|uniref:mandelate racemase/muconate lactonizing enzyme family protein n=1 Tax=Sporomusa sp. KB1 TaxID=943346 RepID=UPI00119CFFAE|nr:mandelate racemase/muconate lactonizing enzyme family protein [Sporomusa sp. KB1]TWH51796.1 L-alanine-DL-glutamate epimerase-like enolase superfamily enzyme [Sporomusa sp. KB1]